MNSAFASRAGTKRDPRRFGDLFPVGARLGHGNRLFLTAGLVVLLDCLPWVSLARQCDVCHVTLEYNVYTVEDKVDRTQKWICETCAGLTLVCYHCGVPVKSGFLTLSDGRTICQRDRVGVVLDEEEALRICRDVERTVQSLFGRFTAFPTTNVHLRLADRIDVRTLVGVAGNDFTCPNLLGYTMSLQKPGHQEHNIRVLSGLQTGVLQTTYAHELAHAWVAEHVSGVRQAQVHPDAIEGFCELVGYLVAESYRDASAMQFVLDNRYTRGQVHLFIEAGRQFGLGDVFDWMRDGETSILRDAKLYEVREVRVVRPAPPRPVSEILFIPTSPPKPMETLELTSITIGPRLSIATVNGRALAVGEERKVPLGGSNLVLRCVSIDPEAVILEHVGSGARERLTLGTSSGDVGESVNGALESNL